MGNWEMAMADYDRAERVDPRLAVVDLARGRTMFEAGRLEPPLARLDRFRGPAAGARSQASLDAR